jgi:hypothetical protein
MWSALSLLQVRASSGGVCWKVAKWDGRGSVSGMLQR